MPGSHSHARCWNPKFSLLDMSILPQSLQLDNNIVFGCQICTLSGELLKVLVVSQGTAAENLFVESGHLNLTIQLATEVLNNFHHGMGYNSKKARNSLKMITVLVSVSSIDVKALRSKKCQRSDIVVDVKWSEFIGDRQTEVSKHWGMSIKIVGG